MKIPPVPEVDQETLWVIAFKLGVEVERLRAENNTLREQLGQSEATLRQMEKQASLPKKTANNSSVPPSASHKAAKEARLVQTCGGKPGHVGVSLEQPDAQRLQKRFRKHFDSLWHFLDRPDVPFTNNASERALRPAVIHRKVIGGFRSDAGATAYALYRTVEDTTRKRGQNLLNTLSLALTEASSQDSRKLG